MVKGKTEMV